MKKITFCCAISILLTLCASAQFINQGSTQSATSNFTQYLNNNLLSSSAAKNKGAVITSFNNEENTVGARFLFNTWVDGDSVVNTQGVLINTTSFLFNFDKMTGNLIATQDKINNMSVSPSGIYSFVLKYGSRRYPFEHVKVIDSANFFLALVKSEAKYSLYKLLAAKFIPSNYRNDGVVQTGNTNNEYKDESRYYVADAAAGKSVEITSVKSKSIKAALPAVADKIDAFFKSHKEDAMDEAFLTKMVAYLNQ